MRPWKLLLFGKDDQSKETRPETLGQGQNNEENCATGNQQMADGNK